MDRTERGKVGRVDQGITDRPKERAAFAGRRIVFHKVPICFHLYGMIISCGKGETRTRRTMWQTSKIPEKSGVLSVLPNRRAKGIRFFVLNGNDMRRL